ncbi:MAG: 4Fe-4S dicluster domain-containing protein [Bacteroidaceae bacterium]|jgi:sulfhydrogenase subunit beta (sulfur reductase)
MKNYQIKHSDLDGWLERIIATSCRVIAPVTQDGHTDFSPIRSPKEVAADDQIQTIQSAKQAAFPKADILFSYRKKGTDTTLEQPSPESYPKTVIWRAHPCDAAGFAPLSAIFNWDYKDNLYNARLERTTLVAFSCLKADAYCFCTSVGGGPGQKAGCDILVTKLPSGTALVEVGTEKGAALTALAPEIFCEANEVAGENAPIFTEKEAALAKIPTRFTREEIRAKLKDAFDLPIWKEQSARCLGCGACAFVCPTCACFDIQEDPHGPRQGRRVRCWDSCGFALFTQHTSGHNPRPTQATRWRQRILHKFSYMPERLAQTGCTGCGRCSRACPVDMNLLEHLTAIAQK